MNEGKFVFAQVMEHLPLSTLHRCIARYSGEHKVKRFSCLDQYQYLSMAFAQLTYRESLRDIEACLRTRGTKLYHLGFLSVIARNTLANANATRDWRIYCDFAQSLIGSCAAGARAGGAGFGPSGPGPGGSMPARRSGSISGIPSTRSTRRPSTCVCRCSRGRRSSRPRRRKSYRVGW